MSEIKAAIDSELKARNLYNLSMQVKKNGEALNESVQAIIHLPSFTRRRYFKIL